MKTSPVLMALAVYLTSAAGFAADVGVCTRVRLESPPSSVAGAIWLRDESGIVMLNNGTRALDVFDLQGKRKQRVSSPGSGPTDFNVPLGISPTETGYLVNDENHHFVWLDRDFHPTASFDLNGGRPEGADELWLDAQSIVVGREAVGLLSRNSRNGVDFGFFRVALDGGGSPQVLESIPMPGDREHHAGSRWRFRAYQTVYRYIAQVEDRIYWLRLDDTLRLHLVEVKGKGSPVEIEGVVPTAYAQWPRSLPEEIGIQDVPGILEKLAASPMISEVLSDGERLYLLGHAPAEHGVRWTLFALDRAARRVEFQKDLPTAAPDVLLIPGQRQIAVLELGAVVGHLRPPASVVLLPRKWLAGTEGKSAWETQCQAALAR